jgi:hypothetical protein
MFEAVHAAVLRRWWRRLLVGQSSVALELHAVSGGAGSRAIALAVTCRMQWQRRVEAALRSAYPNAGFESSPSPFEWSGRRACCG